MTGTTASRAPSRLRADALELQEAVSDLVRIHQFRDRDRICCHDISVTQAYALEALVRRGSGTLNELAGDLYLDKSTASRVMASLERKGYLRRQPHPNDARATWLEVSPAGRALHQRIKADLVAEQEELLRDLEPEVRRGAALLLRRLTAVVAARSGVTVPAGCCS
jgi:DNA-binding MarR family transcriptional regulator